MDRERLVAMANDIAAFFDSEPDKAVAAEGVRFHLTRFWDPRMRREIIAHSNQGGAGLSPTALAAVRALAPVPETP
jgi:formate dehydrogenase subunit delta